MGDCKDGGSGEDFWFDISELARTMSAHTDFLDPMNKVGGAHMELGGVRWYRADEKD